MRHTDIKYQIRQANVKSNFLYLDGYEGSWGYFLLFVQKREIEELVRVKSMHFPWALQAECSGHY